VAAFEWATAGQSEI